MLLSAAILAASIGCSLDADPLTSQAITGGSDEAGYPSAVYLVRWADGGYAARPFCTGVVIAPTVVATAAHCLKSNAPLAPSFGVGTGAAINASGSARTGRTIVAASEFIMNPLYADQLVYGTNADQWTTDKRINDVALVYLTAPIGVAAATITDIAVNTSTTACQELTAVGYGRTDCTDAESGGPRKSATMCLASASDSILYLEGLSGYHSFGDSGGPVFVGAASDQAVVAIHRGQNCPGDRDEVTELGAYRTFLERGITCAYTTNRFACVFPTQACSPSDTRYCAGVQGTCRTPGGCAMWRSPLDRDNGWPPASVAIEHTQYEMLAASGDMALVRGLGGGSTYWTSASPKAWPMVPAASNYAGNLMPPTPLEGTCLSATGTTCATYRANNLLLQAHAGPSWPRGTVGRVIAYDNRAHQGCGVFSAPSATDRFSVSIGCQADGWSVHMTTP